MNQSAFVLPIVQHALCRISLRALLHNGLRLALLLVTLCAASAQAAPRTVLVFGDSLSAGFGIARDQSWPALLDLTLQQRQLGWRVANASISGETTAGGRARLAAALKEFKPAVLILALGANDGLRGLAPAQMRDNLQAMIAEAKRAKVKVLLVGMRLPPNYGPQYANAFEAVFADLARTEKIALLPFLLEPIALRADAFQADRLHPVAAVQSTLRDHVLKSLAPLLR
jgi:acyl-CoA thioesterase-1